MMQNQFPNHNFETSFVEYGKRVDKIVDISTPQTVIISLAWSFIGGLTRFSLIKSVYLLFLIIYWTHLIEIILIDCGFTQMKWEEM